MGVHPRQCPICDVQAKFLAAGDPPRYDARCPSCGSLERHRLFALWLREYAGDVAGKRTIHFAPEPVLGRLLRSAGTEYRSADLKPGRADLVLNIERLALPDASIQLIVCNHVLEHVDHRAALAEFRRVLTEDGLAVLTFPIIEGWRQTYENEQAKTDAARALHFGQRDHVRFFGADIRDHIQQAGFCLDEYTASEPHVHVYGLARGEKLFLARKNETPDAAGSKTLPAR